MQNCAFVTPYTVDCVGMAANRHALKYTCPLRSSESILHLLFPTTMRVCESPSESPNQQILLLLPLPLQMLLLAPTTPLPSDFGCFCWDGQNSRPKTSITLKPWTEHSHLHPCSVHHHSTRELAQPHPKARMYRVYTPVAIAPCSRSSCAVRRPWTAAHTLTASHTWVTSYDASAPQGDNQNCFQVRCQDSLTVLSQLILRDQRHVDAARLQAIANLLVLQQVDCRQSPVTHG